MNLYATVIALTLTLQGSGFSLNIPSLALAPRPDAAVAKVDGVVIKASDVEALLWEAHGTEIISDLIGFQMVKAEADRQGAIATEQEVTQALGDYMKSIAADAPAGTDIQGYLESQGLSKSRLYVNVKTDVLLNKLAKMRFQAARYVKVSTILVTPASNTAADMDAADQKVQTAYQRVKKGEKWEVVAADVISDANAKRTGGLLGWKSLELFPAATRTAIINLKPGEVTEPTRTVNGAQFFRLESQGANATKDELTEIQNIAIPSIKAQIASELRTRVKVEKLFDTKPPK